MTYQRSLLKQRTSIDPMVVLKIKIKSCSREAEEEHDKLDPTKSTAMGCGMETPIKREPHIAAGYLVHDHTMMVLATDEGGKRTPSMMCTTPLLATLSALMTFLRSLESKLGPTCTFPPHSCTCKSLPSTVVTAWKGFNCVDNTCSGRTWYFKMSTSLALFSGFIRVSSVPAGSALNASFVGAKTVNFPAELRVSAKSPATTADTKVLKYGLRSASCTILGLGIGNTVSMMWTTPLLAPTSAVVTFAVLTKTSPPAFLLISTKFS